MAGNGLGMKSPVRWFCIFAGAFLAHQKSSHGCIRTVVRYILDDGKAWTAVCTIDEWVKVAPVVGSEHFSKTIRADADIRGYRLKCIW